MRVPATKKSLPELKTESDVYVIKSSFGERHTNCGLGNIVEKRFGSFRLIGARDVIIREAKPATE